MRSSAIGEPLARLKRLIGRRLNDVSLKRVPVGDMGFDLANVDLSMSDVCAALLRRFDYQAIYQSRRRNYERMYRRLAGRATPLCGPLPPGVCPLFFPILTRDKGAAARALAACGIEATELWNYGDPRVPAETSRDAAFLRRHVLELPIHQGMSPAAVDYTAEQVLRLRL
jgi:hypothetical protein